MIHANHAKRLIRMLESNNVHCKCPVNFFSQVFNRGFLMPDDQIYIAQFRARKNYCNRVCKAFIGVEDFGFGCPCDILGCEEAVKRTLLALEERGFINNDNN